MKSDKTPIWITIFLVVFVLHMSDISYKQEKLGNSYNELLIMKASCEAEHNAKCTVGFTIIATPK